MALAGIRAADTLHARLESPLQLVSLSWVLFLSACAERAPACRADPCEDVDVPDATEGDTGDDGTPGDTDADTADDGDTANDTEDDTAGDTARDTAGDTAGDIDSGEPGSIATVPGELLDLTNWKLTLPIGDPGDPVEIEQPELDTFTLDPYFRLDGDRVAFRANAGGVTTSGSDFARSELREMTADGAEKASWSTTSGVHTLTITQAVTHLPDVVPHLVAGQVHGGSAYVMLVRLDDTRLWVKSDGEDVGELDASYVLGEEFTLRIAVEDGWVDVYYNDLSTPAVSLPYDKSGCYFKAGAYAQSNTDYGDAPEAYAEVQIRGLEVVHE